MLTQNSHACEASFSGQHDVSHVTCLCACEACRRWRELPLRELAGDLRGAVEAYDLVLETLATRPEFVEAVARERATLAALLSRCDDFDVE